MSDYTQAVTQRQKRLIVALVYALSVGLTGLGQVFFGMNVFAGQMTERRITLSTSEAGASSTYAVSFKPTVTTNILGIVVELCVDSPIIGVACDKTNGVTNVPVTGQVTVSHNSGSEDFNVHTNSTADGLLILSHATGLTSVSTSEEVTFSFTATNPPTACGGAPSNRCSYYGRLLTYSAEADAQGYDDEAPGSFIDQGGIALSTANQLTVNARVQEVLQFCVGTDDANTAGDVTDDCSDITGTVIDLGVVDSTLINESANDAGKAMVRTNAVNGVEIVYYAEQENGSGSLKVPGATCAPPSLTDQCFNSVGTTETAITAGTENFGMTSTGVNVSNGITTNLTRDTDYDADVGYAWDDSGSTDILASSTTVVDDEMLELKFAATASPTTPTGAYTVTATFIATATF